MKMIKYFALLLVIAASFSACVVRTGPGWVPGHYNYGPNGGRAWVPGHYN
jgi:hypothetical protein